MKYPVVYTVEITVEITAATPEEALKIARQKVDDKSIYGLLDDQKGVSVIRARLD